MIFEIADLQMQLRGINELAKQFLARSSENLLNEAADQLGYISANQRETSLWEVSHETPVRTRPSFGDYQRNSQGAFNLEGRLSFVWQVKRQHNHLTVTGLAATETSFHRVDGGHDECIFNWHADIASGDGVGPHFHVQVYNPQGLDIPRFPSLMISPADCLDFMLGELFLDDWPRHQAEKDAIKRFAPSQRKRLKKLMKGMTAALNEGGSVSGLNALKRWQPSPDLLVD